jgi:uncharacterized protein GlcG (DUF336 family)
MTKANDLRHYNQGHAWINILTITMKVSNLELYFEMELSLEEAKKIIQDAEAKAKEIGVMMNIAVVDVGGNLVAFERMDKAWLGSVNIAINKAYTAVAFNMTTEDLGKESQVGKSLFGIHATNNGRLVIFGGGIPLKKKGELAGAIGVSGGAVPQDIEVAKAGVKNFK